MACFLENFRGHIARSSTGGGENMELLFVHYPGKTKVCYQEICIVFGSPEQEILRFEVTMDDAMIVEIGNGREGRTDEIGGI
jgi:hypothetical protein